MNIIEEQIAEEQINDPNYQFIRKWIFLIPKVFEKINEILPAFRSEQNPIFKLDLWKPR